MSYPRWTLSACILLFLALAGVDQADEPQLLPRTGILVLRNGRVLRGNILREGDRYVVGLNKYDEVAVPIESVEMHCDSLQEAYQRKRNLLPKDAKSANHKSANHLELADWCLRYDLIPAAAEQLLAAQQCNPLDPANERFEKRLRMAVQQPVSTTSSGKVASPIPSQAELDELVRSLPAGTMEQFTNTIQPLLVNRCGSSGCHGANGKSEFQLVYPNWSRTIPRRFTQRNLQNAIGLLNWDTPDESPLLRMATMAHGGATEPALADDDVTPLAHLADWVYRNLKNKPPTQPATLKEPDALLLQPYDRYPGVSSRGPQSPSRQPGTIRSDPLKNLIDSQVQPASHVEQTRPAQSQTSLGPPPRKAQSGVDPFDPEIFNRRHLK